MSEEPPESRPAAAPDPDHESTRVIPPDRQPGTPKQRFADRLWSLRAVIAVALASVILGGLAGAALATASNDQDDHRRPGMGPRMGPGQAPHRLHPGDPRPRGLQPGGPQWYWRDGPRDWSERRGQGQRQWDQERPGTPFPSGVPTPTAKPTPSD